MFEIGRLYTKKDIYRILDVPLNKQGGAWDTGSREYEGSIYIFANIEISGRTGHNYSNRWIGDILFWHARTNSNINQPSIKKLLNNSIKKHIFTRTNNISPFTYEGLGIAISYKKTIPVQINWSFKELNDIDFVSEQEVVYNTKYKEGAIQKILINAYERNPIARRICIKHYGCKCLICGFNYFDFYGEYAKDFIQVHHIKPIAEIGEDYDIDPIKDLIPICANCHSVIHRKAKTISPQELIKMIKDNV